MQHWLDKLTDLAAIEGDECILKTGLADFAEHFGFTGFAYLHIQHKHIIAVTNYHREWQSTYFDKKFDALDPVVKRARSRKHVFAWSGSRNGRGCRRKSAPSMRMRPITASLCSSFFTSAANPS
nr:autoinducer binding domain-containing protein [Agrobacterium deltaense]